MPAISLPLLGFIFGSLFAWSAAPSEQRGQHARRGDALTLVALFSVFVHAPCATYLLTYNTDWCLGYAIAADTLPLATLPLLSGANLLAAPAGYMLASRSNTHAHLARRLRSAAAALLLIIFNTGAFWLQLGVEASYVEFHNDFGTQGLAGSVLGYALFWMALILTSSGLYTHRSLRRLATESATAIH